MKPLLSAENITIRVEETFLFHNTSWKLYENQQYVITGENGAGKTTFAKALAGLLPLRDGKIILHFVKSKNPYPSVHKEKVAYLSFDTQTKVIQKEEREKDFYAFVGKSKKGVTIKQFLSSLSNIPFSNIPNENRELSSLSTGEQRKVFLLKALEKNPKILILDEPFDGLDKKSIEELKIFLNTLSSHVSIILITHNSSEIPECITHEMRIENGIINFYTVIPDDQREIGNPEMKTGSHISPSTGSVNSLQAHSGSSGVRGLNVKRRKQPSSKILISLQNVNVTHGKNQILKSINWTIKKGENWAIIGHNGAGKSTLLKLLYGDEQQAYSNDIFYFGKHKRYIPLSEIRSKIGYISPDLHMNYATNLSAQDVILSGFFDSIGLYKKASASQQFCAQNIIKDLKLEKVVEKKFESLSFGQKRLVLIARAVVKKPKLLLLDEPFHGLDEKNKKIILDYLGKLGEKTQFIISSHSDIPLVPHITHVLHLKNGEMS